MEQKYNTIKLPIEVIYEVDRYMKSHKQDGFTTRVEVIRTALREFFKNGNKDYQPSESGEERTIQGGNKHEQMANGTALEPNTKRLDDSKRESHKTNNAGA